MSEFSRKTFLKGGGALVVGLAVAPAAQAFNDPKAASPYHTGAVAGPPPANQIDSWIAIHADNTASIYSGRVNLGQGTPNGLLMIAGEELDLDLAQLKWIEADSNVTPETIRLFILDEFRTLVRQLHRDRHRESAADTGPERTETSRNP